MPPRSLRASWIEYSSGWSMVANVLRDVAELFVLRASLERGAEKSKAEFVGFPAENSYFFSSPSTRIHRRHRFSARALRNTWWLPEMML
jgi:hypothetical protein